MFKGYNIRDAQQESIGSITEVACARDAGDGQAHFVLGTDTNQLVNVFLETKDRNSDDFKWDYMIAENPKGGVLDVDICLFKKQIAVASNDKMVRIYSQVANEVRG